MQILSKKNQSKTLRVSQKSIKIFFKESTTLQAVKFFFSKNSRCKTREDTRYQSSI